MSRVTKDPCLSCKGWGKRECDVQPLCLQCRGTGKNRFPLETVAVTAVRFLCDCGKRHVVNLSVKTSDAHELTCEDCGKSHHVNVVLSWMVTPMQSDRVWS